MSKHSAILLEIQYLPTIQYFSKFIAYDTVFIEKCENYGKGSFRNRCHIASSNGLLRLTVPLAKGKNERQPITEVTISEQTPWRSQHWTSIKSAYGSAPYWEFYADELQPIFTKKITHLFDFNLELLKTLTNLIGLDTKIIMTDVYEKEVDESLLDWRSAIHPKSQKHKKDHLFNPITYPQVFEDRIGFLPNLSILDLLFCCGPETILKLEEMVTNQT